MSHASLSLRLNTNIQSPIAIIDQPCAEPPPLPPSPDGVTPAGKDYTNRNWALWTLNQQEFAFGFTESQYLGLARPNLALKNAENYAIFALCLQFPNLKCVGNIVDAIAKRDKVSFELAPEAVKQIQQNRSTMSWISGEEETRRD